MSDFDIRIEAGNALAGLARMQHGTHDASPLMASIATELHSQTEVNFAAEGRPKWLGLSPATIAARTKRGSWPGKILQISAGGLAPSISTSSDATSAVIGSNKVYAAIQQLGGQAGRGRKVTIPARQYLPIDAQGNLQPEAEEGILGIANHYLASIIAR